MLQFTGICIENFGPFRGLQTIDLSEADGVTIIWGNNGRGKTTLLNIIRYALFGKYQNRRGTNVDLLSLANIEGKNEGKYNFKVVLKMKSDGVNYELTRQYTVRKGVAAPCTNDDYEEKVFLKKDNAILSADQREHELKLIMPDEVSRFFLFDGELLQEYEELLVEGTQTGVTIKDSIEQILGVPVLTNSANDVAAVLENYRKEKNKIAQSNAQTQKYAAQIEALAAKKQEHMQEQKRLQVELSEELGNKDRLENEAQQSEYVSALIKNLDSIEDDIKKGETKRKELFKQIQAAAGEAWKGLISGRIQLVLKNIETELQELEKKEHTYQIASHFEEDMKKAVEEKHCHLCDQDIAPEKLEELSEKIKAYTGRYHDLSAEETQTLQALRMRKGVLEKMQAESKREILKLLEDQLASLEIEQSDALNQRKTVREELERFGDISKLSKSIKENVAQLARCLRKIDNLREGIQKEQEKIEEAQNAMAVYEDKLNRASTDAETQSAKRKVELAEDIFHIFEEGIEAYRNKLKEDVESDATDLFVKISNDPDYTRLTINENYGLSIVHSSGRVVPLRSAGFEHIVALSLIGALHKNAPLKGPVIMDSPFGRLDPIHKNRITEILPEIADQVILLVYTEEIDEQYARNTLGTVLKREYRLQRYSSFDTQIELQ